MTRHVLSLSFFLCAFAACALAQTGFPPYGTFQNGKFDAVNLQNLNSVFTIPIMNSPGRHINLPVAVTYNSVLWYGGTPVGAIYPNTNINWGWQLTPAFGVINYSYNYGS